MSRETASLGPAVHYTRFVTYPNIQVEIGSTTPGMTTVIPYKVGLE